VLLMLSGLSLHSWELSKDTESIHPAARGYRRASCARWHHTSWSVLRWYQPPTPPCPTDHMAWKIEVAINKDRPPTIMLHV
jgi:hypothetical protein